MVSLFCLLLFNPLLIYQRYQSLMSFNNENVLSENALQRSQHFYFVYNICAGTQKVWEPLMYIIENHGNNVLLICNQH